MEEEEYWRYIFLLLPIMGFVIQFVIYTGCIYFARFKGFSFLFFSSLFVGFLFLLVFLVVWAVTQSPPLLVVIDRLLLTLSNYLCIGFVFYNIINMLHGSVRVWIVSEVCLHFPRPIYADRLSAIYNIKEKVLGRLKWMEESGVVVRVNGRYFLKRNSLLLLAKVFECLTFIVFGKAVPDGDLLRRDRFQ